MEKELLSWSRAAAWSGKHGTVGERAPVRLVYVAADDEGMRRWMCRSSSDGKNNVFTEATIIAAYCSLIGLTVEMQLGVVLPLLPHFYTRVRYLCLGKKKRDERGSTGQ